MPALTCSAGGSTALEREVQHTEQRPAAQADFVGLALERECGEPEVVFARCQVERPTHCGDVPGKRIVGVVRRAQPEAGIASGRVLLLAQMMLGQSVANDQAEHRRAEDARKHNHGDSQCTHDSLVLCSVGVFILLSPDESRGPAMTVLRPLARTTLDTVV